MYGSICNLDSQIVTPGPNCAELLRDLSCILVVDSQMQLLGAKAHYVSRSYFQNSLNIPDRQWLCIVCDPLSKFVAPPTAA